MKRGRGVFITFEGGEGAGKSTQIQRLADTLRARGADVVTTREPGGSPGAEAVRHVLLSGAAEEFGIRMEAILFAAARADHVQQTIRPAVERGQIVLCDRFMDSTRIYQGITGNLEPAFVERLERIAVDGMVPDLTVIIDLPAEEGLARARGRAARAKGESGPDRFEKETIATHEKRREGFLDLAQSEPARCHVVDGRADADTVAAAVLALAEKVMPARAKRKGERATRARGKMR